MSVSNLTFESDNGRTFPFDGSDGIYLVNQVDGLTTIPTDLIIDQRVTGDGGTLANARRSPRRLTLSFMLTEAPDIVLVEWARLMAALAAGGTLVFDGPNGRRELRKVVLESSVRRVMNSAKDDEYTVSVLALDPWWYGDVSTLTSVFADPSGWDDAISWDAVLPWDGGGSTQVTVEGDTDVYPTFVLQGPFTTLVVGTEDQAWSLANPLLAGSYIAIESYPGHRGPYSGAAGLVPGVIDGPIDWSLLSQGSQLFSLPPGESTVIFGASGHSAPANWIMFWEARWLTP